MILVGHSFSGTVITGVAERVSDRLARLVYLDALVPRDNESVLAAIGAEQAGFLESLAQAHDGWSLPWFTDEQLDQFYGDHGLTAEDRTWIRRHISPQPLATYREALTLTPSDLPRTFIRCTRNPMPPPVEPHARGWSWAELDAGHWPMITAPQATANLLDEIARDTGRTVTPHMAPIARLE